MVTSRSLFEGTLGFGKSRGQFSLQFDDVQLPRWSTLDSLRLGPEVVSLLVEDSAVASQDSRAALVSLSNATESALAELERFRTTANSSQFQSEFDQGTDRLQVSLNRTAVLVDQLERQQNETTNLTNAAEMLVQQNLKFIREARYLNSRCRFFNWECIWRLRRDINDTRSWFRLAYNLMVYLFVIVASWVVAGAMQHVARSNVVNFSRENAISANSYGTGVNDKPSTVSTYTTTSSAHTSLNNSSGGNGNKQNNHDSGPTWLSSTWGRIVIGAIIATVVLGYLLADINVEYKVIGILVMIGVITLIILILVFARSCCRRSCSGDNVCTNNLQNWSAIIISTLIFASVLPFVVLTCLILEWYTALYIIIALGATIWVAIIVFECHKNLNPGTDSAYKTKSFTKRTMQHYMASNMGRFFTRSHVYQRVHTHEN